MGPHQITRRIVRFNDEKCGLSFQTTRTIFATDHEENMGWGTPPYSANVKMSLGFV